MNVARWLLTAAVLYASPATGAAQTQADLFDDSALHEIHLTVNTADWQSLKDHFDENTYYPADLEWRGVTVRNVGIRSRGHVTRNGVKPGLRVDMNRYTSHQDFVGLKALNLKNAFDDPTLIRESVSMKMFALLGLPSPREAHTVLYINNQYVGVYVIVEAIDRTFVGRVYGPDEGSSDHGGYLFEYQDVRQYQFDYLGADLEPYAALFDPKTHENDSAASLYAPIEALVRTVNQASDDRFVADVGKYLDLVEVMKFLAIEDFMAEIDGFVGNWTMNNFYLYRFASSGVSQLIPWDTAMTFSDIAHPLDFNLATNVLTIRARGVPELWQVYLDTLTQCSAVAQQTVDGDSRGWLEHEVARQSVQIEDAVAADPVFPFSLADFHIGVESMRQFAVMRSSYVGCQLSNASNPAGPPQDCTPHIQPAPEALRAR